MDGLNAFVLAGGNSTRMGTDKAFVELDGQTLLQRALDRIEPVGRRVWILGSRAKFESYGPVVEDEFPDHGPLGGIHAALRVSDRELNLILAVDMPFVESRFLEYLVKCARDTAAVVTGPRAEGRWQPLCAVYRRDFAIVAEQALKADKNKIDPLFSEVQVRAIEETELSTNGFTPEMFRNLNTTADVEAVRRM
jgi:molybdopterin-guanine dinucleotide biosynthesis protein A